MLLVTVAPQSLPLECDVVTVCAWQGHPRMHLVDMVFHHILTRTLEVTSHAGLQGLCAVFASGVAPISGFIFGHFFGGF